MKRKRWILPAVIFLLAIAGTAVYVCPHQELRGSLIFFGLLGLLLISGALLMIPLCLLLVKYFKNHS